MDKRVGFEDGRPPQTARDVSYRKYQDLVSKELLQGLYCKLNLSTVDISKQLGISRNTLVSLMDLYGIPRRNSVEAGKDKCKTFKYNENYFSSVDSYDKAYTIGFIMGDGLITRNGNSKRLVIAVAKEDEALLRSIAEALGDGNLIKVRQAKPSNEQDKVILAVNSTHMVEDLMKVGIPLSPKSGKEPFIDFGDAGLTWSFIRGVSDADGCIRSYERYHDVKGVKYGPYKKQRFSLTIGAPFILGFGLFLIKCGIRLSPNAVQYKPGTCLIEISNREAIIQIRDEMYRHGSLYLQRKRDTFFSI